MVSPGGPGVPLQPVGEAEDVFEVILIQTGMNETS